MRIQDLIRDMIDMVDNMQTNHPMVTPQVIPQPVTVVNKDVSPLTHAGDDINRFKQIVDLGSTADACATYNNEPNEKYADLDSVTINAGGGLNGPKHPHDIRVKDPSAYPGMQDASVQQPQDNPHAAHLVMIQGLNKGM